jgi:hypothetical protein
MAIEVTTYNDYVKKKTGTYNDYVFAFIIANGRIYEKKTILMEEEWDPLHLK